MIGTLTDTCDDGSLGTVLDSAKRALLRRTGSVRIAFTDGRAQQ